METQTNNKTKTQQDIDVLTEIWRNNPEECYGVEKTSWCGEVDGDSLEELDKSIDFARMHEYEYFIHIWNVLMKRYNVYKADERTKFMDDRLVKLFIYAEIDHASQQEVDDRLEEIAESIRDHKLGREWFTTIFGIDEDDVDDFTFESFWDEEFSMPIDYYCIDDIQHFYEEGVSLLNMIQVEDELDLIGVDL